jgi:chromosome partitioning protein
MDRVMPSKNLIRLSFVNQKGGVGKTAMLCQFAFYLAIKRGLRVLVIELDKQHHASDTLKLYADVAAAENAKPNKSPIPDLRTAKIRASQIFSEAHIQEDLGVGDASFVLVEGDVGLMGLERQPERHDDFGNHFNDFLLSCTGRFDAVLIDLNPNPDIRMMAALYVSNYVLSPVEALQESLNGIGDLLETIREIKLQNPDLIHLGLLPNKVRAVEPLQKDNLNALRELFPEQLIKLKKKDGKGYYGSIGHRTAISLAQQEGKPVWMIDSSTADKCWRNELEPVFSAIADRMGVSHGV